MIFILNSKVPEDENKRERKDEKFEDQEEVDMNDETYGQNEPPEPEDLDMNADDEIGDGDNENDENPDELPVEVFINLKKKTVMMGVSKRSRLRYGRFTTIFSHFFGNYIMFFKKLGFRRLF